MDFLSHAFLKNAFSLSGAILILLAFSMIQLKIWQADQARYSWVNLLGGIFLFASAWMDMNYGFIFLELAWIVMSLYALVPRRHPNSGDISLN